MSTHAATEAPVRQVPAFQKLPPGPRIPRFLQTAAFILDGPRFLEACRRKYGGAVTLGTLFDEKFVILNPVVPSSDGLSLLHYQGPPLTVGGELNKLASNIATGRNMAGVHWRSDARESLLLGEALAISILRDQKACYNETFHGYTFTKFDGSTVTV